MNKTTKRLLALIGGGCALAAVPSLAGQAPAFAQAAGSASGSGAQGESAAPVAVAEELVTAPFTVEDIDRKNRTLTLRSADGEKVSMSVPADTQGFEQLKKGDKIELDYYRAAVVSVLPAGSAAARNQPREQSQGATSGQGGGGAASRGRQVTSSAEVVSVNRRDNSMKVKGPGGKTQTVSVQDPATQQKIQGVKPGDVVQVTYTEAVVAAIRPSQSRK